MKIGPYPILEELDRGDHHLLYIGTDPKTQDKVAIKVLSEKVHENPDAVKRFLNEAAIISLTDHPNIVKLYGFGEWEKGLYIAMEFLEGIPLRQYLQQEKFTYKKALNISLETAYALCHLHNHGVIHRDLTTENILLTNEEELKVIDFGLSELLVGNRKEPAKFFMGTPFYMSPEQKKDPNSVTFSSDIYSLGIVTYELIVGALCFGTVDLSKIPKKIQPIIQKAVEPNTSKRYQDVVDFITDLSAHMNSLA